jgi:hypothetical protein
MKERVAVKTAILPAAHQAAKNGHISQALKKQQNDQPHQDAHKAEETNLPITHLHHLQKTTAATARAMQMAAIPPARRRVQARSRANLPTG